MAEPTAFPEERFIHAVFGSTLARRCRVLLLSPDSELMRLALRRRIDETLEGLSYRERGILQMRSGLGDGHTYTLAEAGYVFNLTRERIRQIQVRSLRKLRQHAEDLRQFLAGLDV